jgi:sarcosine oxidase subunit gamma
MSPDEVLLFVAYDQAGALAASLGAALAGEHHLAVDVSDARAVITLAGANVAEVLAKGASVDLGAAAFPAGTARRSHIGGVAVGFWRKSEHEWEIVCFSSFARYLFDWLVESSKEGGEVGAF